MFNAGHVGRSNMPIKLALRVRLAAVMMGLVVAAVWLASATPALAFNPCNEPDPPPRCTPPDPSPPPPPAAPTNLTVSGALTSTATLTWTDNATTEASYDVYRSSGTLSSVPFALLAPIAVLPANPGTGQMTFVNSGLDPNAAYTYEVVAVGAPYHPSPGTTKWTTAPSSAVNFPGIPAAPSIVLLQAAPWGHSPTLIWVNHATNATGIKLYSEDERTVISTFGPSTTLAHLPIIEYDAGHTVCYKLVASNPSGDSSPAGFCYAWPPQPPPLPAVTGLGATADYDHGLRILWSWHGVSPSSYYLTFTDKTTGSTTNVGYVTNTSQWESPVVTPGHTYELSVTTSTPSYPISSSPVTADFTVPSGSSTSSGIKTLNLYNCSGENMEIWLWSGNAWVDEGDAEAVPDGQSCGKGYSQPFAISLPTGKFSLDGTVDDDQPSGDNTVWGPYAVTGDSTNGGTFDLSIT